MMLTIANLRKNKGQTASLLLFVIIAAMFLNIGLVIFFGINRFYDERADELNAAHLAIIDANPNLLDEQLRYLQSVEGVTETEVLPVVGGLGNAYLGGTEGIAYIFFTTVSAEKTMNPCTLVGDFVPLTGNAIYLPYFMELNYGYEIGDSFKLGLAGVELEFSFAGSTEEIMYGSVMNSVYLFYVADEKFAELQKEFPDHCLNLVSARFADSADATLHANGWQSETLLGATYYELGKMGRTMIPTIAAIFVVIFAMVLLAVSMIVIRFRITNSIEESMTNIGALKAVGYTSKQIIASLVLQFALIAGVGGLLGVTASLPALPAIVCIMKPIYALVWKPSFDLVSALISVAAVLFAVLFIAYLTARRINKLHPLIALRGGLTTHSFKKNTLPLDSSKGSLDFLLGLKHFLQNKKQAVTISMIIAAVTMMSVLGIAINYNVNIKGENLARATFGEMPDANFTLKDASEGEAFRQRLNAMPEVRKMFGYEVLGNYVQIGETGLSVTIVEDCALLEGAMLIEGRYPKHNNEITLSPVVLRAIGKNVNDTVIVKNETHEKEYIITGMVQFMNNNGYNGIISGAGYRSIEPEFEFLGFNVYLVAGADGADFIEKVKADDGAAIDRAMDVYGQMESMLDTIGAIFAAVAVGIVAITAFIVVLTLYMVIKTIILQRRRELGIKKAVGFTTLQLMNQIALNMTPIILIGVVIGTVVGYFGFNPLFVALTAIFGVVKLEMPVPLDWVGVTCVGLVVLAYIVSMLIAWRIRKISAYGLVSE
jgi:putative ABC transport system permease protein